MVNIQDVPIHGYAAAALHLYKDKVVEINTGEVRTKHVMDQFEHEIKHVLRGKIREAIGDALVLEVNINGKSKLVLINCWSIKSITALDGKGSLKDVYFDEDKRIDF